MLNQDEKNAYKMLQRYKSALTQSQYNDIKFVISNQVLEGLYPSEQDLQDMVDVVTGIKTNKEVIREILSSKRLDKKSHVRL